IGFVICAAATLYGYYTYIRPLVHVQLKFDLNALSLIWLLLGVVAIFGSTTQVLFLNEASKKYPAAISLASTLSAIFYNVGIFNDSRTSFEIRWFN
ncbi:MFS transporter, partial [Lactobacillus acidophilus]|nr:MFS transporter [Lactobacillus acidophilus]